MNIEDKRRKMKNLKLSMKMFIGFGATILIVSLVGSDC